MLSLHDIPVIFNYAGSVRTIDQRARTVVTLDLVSRRMDVCSAIGSRSVLHHQVELFK